MIDLLVCSATIGFGLALGACAGLLAFLWTWTLVERIARWVLR
jgi:hypothetical protein